MPGVEIEEGHEEVQADGRGGGDDEIGEDVVADGDGSFIIAGVRGELEDDDVEGAEGGVGHYYRVDNHGREEHFLGTGLGVSWDLDRELMGNEEWGRWTTDPCGRFPMERMNCKQMSRTQV